MGKRVHMKVDRPAVIKPMLATLTKQPFNSDDYIYEVKWDGYRIIAICDGDKVKLQSRGGEDFTRKYPPIAKALKRMELNCILDGEVVYINNDGKPDFDALQRVNGQESPIVYYAFDLLWLNGQSMMGEILLDRKEKLKEIIKDDPAVKFSDHFNDGLQLFATVQKIGLEGIVAKQKDSTYIQGDRSKRSLKIPTEKRQEFVIGGWIESEKRNTFRTLLFGAYQGNELKWIGHAGGGFKEREMPKILEQLKAIEIKTNPFSSEVEYSEGKPHWVKPVLVANIKYAAVTRSGKIRKPAIFQGFRNDKKATEVVLETPAEAKKQKPKEIGTSEDSNWPVLEAIPITIKSPFEVEDCHIEISNIERELWKGITKGHLIQYYADMSKYILPHVQNRPLSLHVKHRGVNAPGLYIKDMEGREPDCAEVFSTPRKHKKKGKRDVIDYLVCNNLGTLLYVVNLGCIDLNPWTSVTGNSLHPDFVVIDLDPSDGDFKKAIEAALAAKEFFDEHNLKAFIKTSGKTGLHLFLPCSGITFPQARTIAENICESINTLIPEITTTAVTVSDRGNKLYLDPNQNDYADTVASAYSARPFKSPNVSTPIEWKELRSSLSPESFNINNAKARVEKKGDIFFPVLDRKIALKNVSLKQFL